MTTSAIVIVSLNFQPYCVITYIGFAACIQPSSRQVFDAQKDAKQLRWIMSSSSIASYGSSILRKSQAKAIHMKRFNLQMDDTPPKWDSAGLWPCVDAKLYTYVIDDIDEPLKKASKPFRALLAPMPFGKGAMRFAFYVTDEENRDRKYVGKVYQFYDPVIQQKSIYEGDMESQAVASFLAKEFSLRYPESPIEFVPAQLLDLGDVNTFPFRFMALEPWIPGKYEKKTSNAGHIAKDSELAQAFSHYTWQMTGGEIMVVDIQGVGNTLTDPQIHSLDTDRFGRGNLCSKGMDAFFLNHVCNDICRTLELHAHPHQPGSLPQELPHHLNPIEEEAPKDENADDSELQVDWMPIPGSKLGDFLDAVRKDAEDLDCLLRLHSCLGGAVFEWKDRPEIVEIKKGSPAEKAGCEAGVVLKLVSGKPVEELRKKEILELLAAENNMIVGMATRQKIQTLLDENIGLSKEDRLVKLKDWYRRLELRLKVDPTKEGLMKGLKDLVAEMEENVKTDLFLKAVSAAAAKKLQMPEAPEGWDEQLAASWQRWICFPVKTRPVAM